MIKAPFPIKWARKNRQNNALFKLYLHTSIISTNERLAL